MKICPMSTCCIEMQTTYIDGYCATSNAVLVDSTKGYISEVELGVPIVFTITIIIDADCFCLSVLQNTS